MSARPLIRLSACLSRFAQNGPHSVHAHAAICQEPSKFSLTLQLPLGLEFLHRSSSPRVDGYATIIGCRASPPFCFCLLSMTPTTARERRVLASLYGHVFAPSLPFAPGPQIVFATHVAYFGSLLERIISQERPSPAELTVLFDDCYDWSIVKVPSSGRCLCARCPRRGTAAAVRELYGDKDYNLQQAAVPRTVAHCVATSRFAML